MTLALNLKRHQRSQSAKKKSTSQKGEKQRFLEKKQDYQQAKAPKKKNMDYQHSQQSQKKNRERNEGGQQKGQEERRGFKIRTEKKGKKAFEIRLAKKEKIASDFKGKKEGSISEFRLHKKKRSVSDLRIIKKEKDIKRERGTSELKGKKEGGAYEFRGKKEGSVSEFKGKKEGNAYEFRGKKGGSVSEFKGKKEGGAYEFRGKKEGSVAKFKLDKKERNISSLQIMKKERLVLESKGRRHRNRQLWKKDEGLMFPEGVPHEASHSSHSFYSSFESEAFLPKPKKKKEKKPVDFSSSKPQFLLSANHHSHWPPALYHEIAFWGRSNVGKSSLLNELLGCSLAHVSKTPGRTQQLNFYHHPKGLYFVDMPGYGYAQAPLREQGFWERHILSYLEHRPSLKHLYLLLDSRRGIMDLDEQVFSLLRKMQISFSIVFTKKDTLPPYAFKELQEKIRDSAFLKNKHVFFVSAKTKEGFDVLKDHVYPSVV